LRIAPSHPDTAYDRALDHAPDGPALRSALGHTRDGAPLSSNRGPSADLSPWIARLYAAQVEMDEGQRIDCGVLADTPVLRILFTDGWTAKTRDGHGRFRKGAVLFGPHTRRMPVGVAGSFSVLGVALKPGAMTTLKGPVVADTLDRVIPYDHIYAHHEWGTSDQLLEWFDASSPPERWMAVAEKLVRQLVERAGGAKPDPVIEAFDKAAFADPNLSIADFAADHAIQRRRLERMIKRAFGQTATQVLCRARALDIAAHLRGVADDAEEEEAMLRFFDQSHMIREFKRLFGMTPRQFAEAPLPLLTLTLEARQARRLEVLGRSMPGTEPPWRA